MGIDVNTGIEELDTKIREWFSWDQNKTTISEVEELVKQNNVDKLGKMFLTRMEFGTAGLRGCMGPGYSQMNDLVVIQTAQGLVQYLLKTFPDCAERGFVVGYDGRHNSRRFAELTTAVFVEQGVQIYLTSDVCPTPFVPFAVTQFGCVAGVMVTASHNPKEDNGYKVYWCNGSQIISPHDKEIKKHILSNLKPLESSWNTSVVQNSNKIKDPLSSVMSSYYEKLGKLILYPELTATTPLRITYTAMHGVGYKYMVEAFRTTGLKDMCVVAEQRDPDPEFPTVKFPNPEEGKSALNLSIKTAEENNSTLILANDPDADRLAVAEKDMGSGHWKIFNGNEIGALLGWWMFHCYKYQHPDVQDFGDVYMLSSTVSSKILNTMAVKEGFLFEETLTGFKWMGNVASSLIKNNKKVLFAFEEAIGFMCGTAVLDKDGVSAAVKVAEMAAFLLQTHNLTLSQQLHKLYCIYGRHITLNSYFICHEPTVINKIFYRLRNFSEENYKSYPASILQGKYEITGIRDLTTGYDNSYDDSKARLPTSKSSEMITFKFDNGLVATLRTSGTEPKVKYYTELCADPSIQNVDVLQSTLQEMVDAIVTEFLQPELNGLISRTD